MSRDHSRVGLSKIRNSEVLDLLISFCDDPHGHCDACGSSLGVGYFSTGPSTSDVCGDCLSDHLRSWTPEIQDEDLGSLMVAKSSCIRDYAKIEHTRRKNLLYKCFLSLRRGIKWLNLTK